jgi:transcriptional regulator with XRE-family HTH domain
MARTLDEVIASLPATEQARIERRYRELKQEVESLRELRRLAGKAQTDVAAALKIAQPSVSKIEKQADMYLSTLRGYVEAVGGRLDLVVHLPGREPLRLEHFRDATALDQPALRDGRAAGPSR